jgi:hypothetical protein
MIPNSVQILGSTFKIIQVAPDNLDEVGFTDVCGRIIKISPDVPADVQLETFYHEIVHAILALAGISHTIDEKEEEAIAQCLGYGLLHFLTTNPNIPVLEVAHD